MFEFLYDGEAPDNTIVQARIDAALADREITSIGMWVLDGGDGLGGFTQLRPDETVFEAEVSYALDPNLWGQGLAVAIAWATISHGFQTTKLAQIFAGTDKPNLASQAVMKRLGMTYRGIVEYPLGEGVEYLIKRGEKGPERQPRTISIV